MNYRSQRFRCGVAVLSLGAALSVQASPIFSEDFEGADPLSSFSFMDSTAGGSGNTQTVVTAVGSNSSQVVRVVADTQGITSFPGAWISTVDALDTGDDFTLTFDVYIEDQGNFSDGTIFFGDLSGGVTNGRYYSYSINAWEASNEIWLQNDSAAGSRVKQDTISTLGDIQHSVWYSARFSWASATETMSYELTEFGGGATLVSDSRTLTLSNLVHIGWGSGNDTAQYDNILIEPTPLVPVISVSTNSGIVPLEVVFDASASVANAGTMVSYEWDFGDGNTGSGDVVTNTYAESGEYTAILLLVDDLSNSNSASVSIKVTGPAVEIGLIADAVNSSTPSLGNIEYLLSDPFDYDPHFPTADTPSLLYSDGFHGNNAEGTDVIISFMLSNAYTTVADTPVVAMDIWGRNAQQDRDDDLDVILYNGSYSEDAVVGWVKGVTVVDGALPYVRAAIDMMEVGTVFDRVQIIGHDTAGDSGNQFTLTEVRLAAVDGDLDPLTGVINVSTNTGFAPLTVDFDAEGSVSHAGIDSYSWDLGDGTTATGFSVSHTYQAAGSYTVTLTLVDLLGTSDISSVVIDVEAPVTAVLHVSTNMGPSPLAIDFDGSASSSGAGVTEYNWDFGDGNSDSGPVVSHTYTTNGEYTATLTVVDGDGYSNSASVGIFVYDPEDIINTYLLDGGFESAGTDTPWLNGSFQTTTVRSGTYAMGIGGDTTNTVPRYQNTGYIVQSTDEFTLEFYAATRYGWLAEDAAYAVLYTTDDNTDSGTRTVIGSFAASNLLTQTYSAYGGTVVVESLDASAQSAVVGQELFIEFASVIGGPARYGRVDDVSLKVRTFSLPEIGEVSGSVSGSDMTFTWAANELGLYTVQMTDNLSIEGWDDLETLPGTNGLMSITLPMTNSEAFYRVIGE